ncbi:ABC transporter permease [Bosea caraganae]|uniref:ABC transporter permease n=1 Tax=Bosea caraganae TaxID=2763117 RepID=A0A370L2E2_9HYPH|nr:ABC transporter permease [Bosea caraganae]RDJ22427.1 ABC transporter permease [Bosea caraganae]RDJ30386.1 ABC transporter permease [Bosea caraganae]
MIGRLALRLAVAAVLLFLLAPLVVVVVASFSDGPVMAFPPASYTTRWYAAISDEFWQAAWRSSVLATVSMVVAVVVGTPAGITLARGEFRGKAAISAFCLSPLMVPALVLAVASYQLSVVMFDLTGTTYAGSFGGLVLGHIALTIPFVIRAVIVGHTHLDASLEEAARGLGAGPFQTLRLVTLPQLGPSILSGGVFAFAASFEDLPISLFLGGGDAPTLPVQIYSTVEFNLGADLMAISSVIIAASFAVLFILERVVGVEKVINAGKGAH